MSDDRGPLNVPADDVAGTLAARRQLGPDAEEAVIAEFLERTGKAIDRRVDERLTVTPVPTGRGPDLHPDEDREGRKDAKTLAIWSIILGFPITGVTTQFQEYGPLVAIAAWVAIALINIVFNRRQYR